MSDATTLATPTARSFTANRLFPMLRAGLRTAETIGPAPAAARVAARVFCTPVPTKLASTTFYLGRETVIPSRSRRQARAAPPVGDPPVGRMARWRQRLFIVMARNAQPATVYFRLPANRVLELGAQIQF